MAALSSIPGRYYLLTVRCFVDQEQSLSFLFHEILEYLELNLRHFGGSQRWAAYRNVRSGLREAEVEEVKLESYWSIILAGKF